MKRTIFVNGCQVEINHDGTSIFSDGKAIKTYLQSKGSKKKNSGKFYRCNIGGKSYLVHRLVAQAFISNPENLPYVTHIDTNTENNDYRNLWWGNQKTVANNMKAAGRSYKNANNDRANSKIPFKTVPKVVKMICSGLTLNQIAKEFNTSDMSIHRIKKRYCGSLKISPRPIKPVRQVVTPEQRSKIRDLWYSTGMTTEKIAEVVGVTEQSVRYHIRTVKSMSSLSLAEVYNYARMMEYSVFCSFIAKRMGGILETECPKNFINNIEVRQKECADERPTGQTDFTENILNCIIDEEEN